MLLTALRLTFIVLHILISLDILFIIQVLGVGAAWKRVEKLQYSLGLKGNPIK